MTTSHAINTDIRFGRHLPVLMAGSLMAVLFSVSVSAESYPTHKTDELVKICEAIRDDNTTKLRFAIRDSKIRVKALQEGLRCNGDDMLTFADRHDATQSGDLLARRLRLSERTMTARR
ncbi:DUF3718 domain-containing protein [Aestuariibacter sp. A3R04]|uniref:DUF3718 domain-containing protein n=1 Tax=Aestuariibacter sp. A3R04 TaxID=2841571 RepID=UPI001C081B9B|nr:DUF3718 domain-containing protein [Aestuariibacter sp. A3R04]MBU3022052.1 DUF3718 domain-containing protein [Aestuariibacter sp. A3R04]